MISAPKFSNSLVDALITSFTFGSQLFRYSLGTPIFLPLISWSILELKSPKDLSKDVESYSSFPDIIFSTSPQSFAVLAIGPIWSRELAKAINPYLLTNP